MVESNPQITQVFTEEWVVELQEKEIFSGDPSDWLITEENMNNVLRAI